MHKVQKNRCTIKVWDLGGQANYNSSPAIADIISRVLLRISSDSNGAGTVRELTQLFTLLTLLIKGKSKKPTTN